MGPKEKKNLIKTQCSNSILSHFHVCSNKMYQIRSCKHYVPPRMCSKHPILTMFRALKIFYFTDFFSIYKIFYLYSLAYLINTSIPINFLFKHMYSCLHVCRILQKLCLRQNITFSDLFKTAFLRWQEKNKLWSMEALCFTKQIILYLIFIELFQLKAFHIKLQ